MAALNYAPLDSVRQLVTGIQQQSALEDITELKILDNLLEENSSNLNFFAVADKTVDGTFLIAGIDENRITSRITGF